jgi:Na+:H+ antiporter, NhaA family
MGMLRSERVAAILLLAAAAAGLVLANSPLAAVANSMESLPIGPLSLGHWVKDGLLAIFFFLAAIELRHELRHGELNSPTKALVPTVAAVGGVIVPALLYILLAPSLSDGWPIPTATDIAFALGVLAVVGRNLPPRFRALLLALAVIDDLIAILIIAVFFTADLQPLPLLLAVPVILLFGWLSHRMRVAVVPVLVVLGLLAWTLVWLSGIHPTIAGVALGLILADAPAVRVRGALEPWSNAIVLPLFALVAALVPLPTVAPSELSPAFWAVLIALPVGKLLGITAGTLLAAKLAPRGTPLPFGDVIAIAGLGGIGFTVSLLMNELAFGGTAAVADQVTLAVLVASLFSAVVGGTLTALRSRHYARRVT